jgi:CRISPR-associated protein Cas2
MTTSRSKGLFIVIAYDIESDRRRNRLVKKLKDYGGRRVNFSVFECRLEHERFKKLVDEIEGIIRPRADSVLFYDLCASCQRKSQSLGVSPEEESAAVVTV